MEKLCFPPLFTPGFHDVLDYDLKVLCVDRFPSSTRRGMLYCNYVQLTSQIRSINSQFKCFLELWVDGSFTTEKPEPDDIDLLLVADYHALNTVPPMFQSQLELLVDRDYIKQNYSIDLLLLYKNNPSSNYENDRMYWRGCFGYDRNEHPKGLARVTL
ncbi:DUF6932 family protein [Biostraticola tofi]|uniref:Uncharacterized protein n=1 Tax=Biostraticola tofi TaxID=466109 RepID=A0A4V2W5M9_9GAMM|nr:hypothetical protein [Biostraticola tofi]TCW00426.1 hypothetical protein EDC52_101776 [Biostraticola tofi]